MGIVHGYADGLGYFVSWNTLGCRFYYTPWDSASYNRALEHVRREGVLFLQSLSDWYKQMCSQGLAFDCDALLA